MDKRFVSSSGLYGIFRISMQKDYVRLIQHCVQAQLRIFQGAPDQPFILCVCLRQGKKARAQERPDILAKVLRRYFIPSIY